MIRPRFSGAAALLCAATLALSGCASVSRDWPAASDSRGRSALAAGYDLIPIDADVARLSRSDGTSAAVPPGFFSAAPEDYARFAKGDSLSVTIWEKDVKGKGGLFIGPGERRASLDPVTIDELGQIYLPYAGFIEAAGKTTAQLRRILRERLAERTSDLQIEIRRTGESGRRVSIQGLVEAGGVYPLSSETDSLLRLLAKAGGSQEKPEQTIVTLRRGQSAARLTLADLYRTPRYDLALAPDDAVIVERDGRFFTIMGAVPQPGRKGFSGSKMSLMEALALGGGFDGRDSRPRAVYILRAEGAERLTLLRHKRLKNLARDDAPEDSAGVQTTALEDPTLRPGLYRVIYLLDLGVPEALFYAKAFEVRPDDSILVSERAPSRSGAIDGF